MGVDVVIARYSLLMLFFVISLPGWGCFAPFDSNASRVGDLSARYHSNDKLIKDEVIVDRRNKCCCPTIFITYY